MKFNYPGKLDESPPLSTVYTILDFIIFIFHNRRENHYQLYASTLINIINAANKETIKKKSELEILYYC
jgi:hypothetical protein